MRQKLLVSVAAEINGHSSSQAVIMYASSANEILEKVFSGEDYIVDMVQSNTIYGSFAYEETNWAVSYVEITDDTKFTSIESYTG